VPDLVDNEPGGETLSVRERLVLHQNNPACSGCHSVLDPLGFALENFDGIGRYRARDASGVIDNSGQLADGTPVNGAQSLRETLAAKPGVFVDTFTEKLFTYALGRGLDYHDMPVVRAITRSAAEQEYRFSALVKGIVTSAPFSMKRAAETVQTTMAAVQDQTPRARDRKPE
jgi:hypothetical protein